MGFSDLLSGGGILGSKVLGDFGGILPIGGAAAGYAIGGPVGGLIGFGMGSSISSAQDATQAAREANSANIKYAQETNATAIDLANTAHQREIADLRAAGLNPILSAKYGGSSTPPLMTPHMESLSPSILSSARNVQDIASGGASLAMQNKLQQSQVAVNSAQSVKLGLEAERQAMENSVYAANKDMTMKSGYNKMAREMMENRVGAKEAAWKDARPDVTRSRYRRFIDLITGKW